MRKTQSVLLIRAVFLLPDPQCNSFCFLFFFFQVDFAKVLHYVGAGVAFPSSMLFVCLQSALTYRLAKTQEEYWIGHIRVGMALLALIALVLSILEAYLCFFQHYSTFLVKHFPNT